MKFLSEGSTVYKCGPQADGGTPLPAGCSLQGRRSQGSPVGLEVSGKAVYATADASGVLLWPRDFLRFCKSDLVGMAWRQELAPLRDDAKSCHAIHFR